MRLFLLAQFRFSILDICFEVSSHNERMISSDSDPRWLGKDRDFVDDRVECDIVFIHVVDQDSIVVVCNVDVLREINCDIACIERVIQIKDLTI